MVSMAITGLLLAVKKKLDWIQPPSQKGTQLESLGQIAPIEKIAGAVFALQIPELSSHKDFDRFELHPDKNIFKVTSKMAYREVQVDASTGKVLSVASATISSSNICTICSSGVDRSTTGCYLSAPCCCFGLGLSGVYMFTVPIARRVRFRRKARIA